MRRATVSVSRPRAAAPRAVAERTSCRVARSSASTASWRSTKAISTRSQGRRDGSVTLLRRAQGTYNPDEPHPSGHGPYDFEVRIPTIGVIGVGGAGGNTVDNMIKRKLERVRFLAANTDLQQLGRSLVDERYRFALGPNITKGLGAGARPDIGRRAAEASLPDILPNLEDLSLLFVTAGMGGGTGTGAAPVIAKAAKAAGVLTVGIVTKPFEWEGTPRAKVAEAGLAELEKEVDTLIVIHNQKLITALPADLVANLTLTDAFSRVNDILYNGIRSVTYPLINPGLINTDFANLETIMKGMGRALMGTGEASGTNRAITAAKDAIENPLLESTSLEGAKGILVCVSGGSDLKLIEVNDVLNYIGETAKHSAEIIHGSVQDEELEGRIRVDLVVTGLSKNASPPPKPAQQPQQTPLQQTAKKTWKAVKEFF